jgi:hypothetical protein
MSAPETPASAKVAIPAWQARSARQKDRNSGAGGFAEPHVEVEQWMQLQFA